MGIRGRLSHACSLPQLQKKDGKKVKKLSPHWIDDKLEIFAGKITTMNLRIWSIVCHLFFPLGLLQ
jgi:hypothetical protein